MYYPYEKVIVKEEVPVFILMTTVKYVAMHWHDRVEFLLVLRGKAHVIVGREEYSLQENDLLLVNSNEVHGVESEEDNTILIVQIPISFIKKCYKNIEQERFHCQSFLHENQQPFNDIRTLLTQLCLTVREEKESYDLKVHSLLLDIIYHLVTNFKVKNKHELKQTSRKNIERMNRITYYIEKNYMHPLTLEELAETERLTPPYLSRYFQQHIGQTFLKYLNGIRLEHAIYYLLETDLPIIQIAMECGFTNLNTFHKLFKDTFHTTPHQYRKNKTKSFTTPRWNKEGTERYEFVEENNLHYLYEYLEKDKNRYDLS